LRQREERNFSLLTLPLLYTYMLKHAINTSQGLGTMMHLIGKKIHGRKE
jgi:hypothetical protein